MELLIVAFNLAMALLIAGARMGQDEDGRFDEDADALLHYMRSTLSDLTKESGAYETAWIDAMNEIKYAPTVTPEPVEPAIGGNQNSCWYYICPICQLAIDKGDRHCRHCGRAVKWDAAD